MLTTQILEDNILMNNMKVIREKIASIRNIIKITKAMEMISKSKMQKAKNNILSCRPYINALSNIINHFPKNNLIYRKHPFFEKRHATRAGYLVISTNRGLCGSLNANLFKQLASSMKNQSRKFDHIIAVIGSKGISLAKELGFKVSFQVESIDDTSDHGFKQLIRKMIDLYKNYHINKLYIASNKFINTLSIMPKIHLLLPLEIPANENLASWDYIYEEEPMSIINDLVDKYMLSLTNQYFLENLASEHASRAISMQAASDNGKNLIEDLKLMYNKRRQNSITQEIMEIVSGSR